ncbi:L-serine ammonia-lyase, iron-sulfur-dependent, subunit alpha [Proteiniclasticum sp. QWL-01]|uniref:L-cysteine desulfidase family protein n=1 Tax=Proteiniclasticum sp. QWL-01 TaxID=3036945 RepID=UPI002410BA16|nr:L-serine ammonia-lyase, iron-sulfur-dependent, subunit alpha [Proteiniclasticum sp. QWL-01]WFF73109.1 L-serine ammonia-lyase, iron-sulfur-dependent, subunit alpha [Proteiniclasticum sp. QWL-01]
MHKFSQILKDELICALGCTEPIAVALASARARAVLGSIPASVDAYCSGNIIKNVMGVTVPNSQGMKGIDSAVALGIVGGKADLGLEVLSGVTETDLETARQLIADNVIRVHLKEGVPNLNIEIHMEDARGNKVIVEIMNQHNNIVRISLNGEEFMEAQVLGRESEKNLYDDLSMKAILDYADTVGLEEIRTELDNQMKLNAAIAQAGLTQDFGSSIGKILLSGNNDIRTRARAKAAAGSDARMSGCALPVVINAGSGNQGITCSLPVMEYAREMGADQEKTMRALLVSNLTALHIKRYIGRLSAFCGVTSAGAAAGAGIAYLHDSSNRDLIYQTVANALMIDSGMVCDGAKPSCAAKIASAVDAGITGFEMAKTNRSFKAGEGLLKEDIEETIRSIGRFAAKGMKQTDIEVLNIMLDKTEDVSSKAE